jgi:glutamyl-tRNA synthetase
VVGLIKERAHFISEFWELSDFFFETPKGYNEKAAKKIWKDDTDSIMKELVAIISATEAESKEVLQETIKNWINSTGIGFGRVMQPLRLALVGALKGPDLFDIMFMIGRDEVIRRLELAIDSF